MLSFQQVVVNPQTPTQSWNSIAHLCNQQEGILVQKNPTLRLVCISDTHCCHRSIELPEGDILIHTGDVTRGGTYQQIKDFLEWFSVQPFSHRIWIAGNHDITLQQDFYLRNSRRFHKLHKEDPKAIQALVHSYTSVVYLQDELVECAGLRIYGSPWQPTFFDWGFNAARGEDIAQKWAMIPSQVDILLTHGPPLGFGDRCHSGVRAGCADLLHHIMYRIKPKVHVFGHIHEAQGMWHNGTTQFINAAVCDTRYQYAHPPKVYSI